MVLNNKIKMERNDLTSWHETNVFNSKECTNKTLSIMVVKSLIKPLTSSQFKFTLVGSVSSSAVWILLIISGIAGHYDLQLFNHCSSLKQRVSLRPALVQTQNNATLHQIFSPGTPTLPVTPYSRTQSQWKKLYEQQTRPLCSTDSEMPGKS